MQIHIRQLTIEEKPHLLELFRRVPPTIARMSSRLVYNAIIADALRTRNVAIFVASLDNNLVGYTIAAWDWNYFRHMFVLRHPLVGLMVLADWIKKMTLKPYKDSVQNPRTGNEITRQQQTGGNGSQTLILEESAKEIVRVIFIGTDPQVRGMGLGLGLYAHLIPYFRQQGFTRIVAHIRKRNIASINMHKKARWTVIHSKNGYFAFFDLSLKKRAIT